MALKESNNTMSPSEPISLKNQEDGGASDKQGESRSSVALEGLLESEQRLRAITDSARDAILMMDPQGKISFWNPAAERILGYSSAEALGQNLHNLIVPERFHKDHHSAFPKFLRSGQGAAIGQTLEMQARRKDGQEIDVALSLSACQIKNSWHAVGIIRDITEKKAANQKLIEFADAMEQKNLELDMAALAAQEATKAKSEFLANMSHEIRTPMNGVIGMTGLLLGTELSADQRPYVEILQSSGETLLSLINDILDFSKIEAHKLDLDPINFDLRATMEDFADDLALRAQAKNIEFTYLVNPEVPGLVKGDPGRLRQILNNLAGNAIKFTHQGEIGVIVSLSWENDQEVELLFRVRDTGIGIPHDKQAQLFTPFTQTDGSTTRKYGGTGLGLAISKRLTEMMGGEIGLESIADQGSTFWFTALFQKQIDLSLPTPEDFADLKGVNILVVDDNTNNRLMAASLLKSWHCRFTGAPDGPTAIDLIHKQAKQNDPFDIAILDMQMPDMDGEELGRRIKNDPAISQTKLVLMTTLGRRGEVARMEQIGFSGYLTKPVRKGHLKDCLALVMGRKIPSETTATRTIVTRHTVAEASKSRFRILLAEDNVTNQMVAKAILKNFGYQAEIVNNGAEAVKALEKTVYDLVLMDCQMPEMDGFEATRCIRKGQAKNPQVPIVAMTAHAMKGDREKCLEAGMDDYLAKPVQPAELGKIIDHWLRKKDTEEFSPVIKDSAEAPVFLENDLVGRLMGDKIMAQEIINEFLLHVPGQIEDLRQSLANSNIITAHRIVHSLKGAAANIGAPRLNIMALTMEQSAEKQDLEPMRRLLPELEERFVELAKIVKQRPMAEAEQTKG